MATTLADSRQTDAIGPKARLFRIGIKEVYEAFLAVRSFAVFACGFLTILAAESILNLDERLQFQTGEFTKVDLSVLPYAVLTGLCCMMAQHVSTRSERSVYLARELEMAQKAKVDPLTGLASKFVMDETLAKLESTEQRFVALFDVKRFAEINNLYSYQVGDEILAEIARRLKAAFPSALIVCRVHTDVFCVISEPCKKDMDARMQIEAARVLLTQPYKKDIVIDLAFAIGVAYVGESELIEREVMRRADAALHNASSDRDTQVCFYSADIVDDMKRRRKIEHSLRRAVEDNGVVPHFQPIVDIATREIIGFEVLARWTDEEMGSIPPSDFIAVAETSGLITQLSENLLEEACKVAAAWPRHISLSVNLAPTQLSDPATALRMLSILGATGFPSSRLNVEITESAALEGNAASHANLAALRKAGVKVYLDDFGTGYCSFERLASHEIDGLKIDKSFVMQMSSHQGMAAVVKSSLLIAKQLGLSVTAEGVDSPKHHDLLANLGCGWGQGHFYGMPQSSVETNRIVLQTIAAQAKSKTQAAAAKRGVKSA
jgi:diguanylate cyclase (GGDEF)-like protein